MIIDFYNGFPMIGEIFIRRLAKYFPTIGEFYRQLFAPTGQANRLLWNLTGFHDPEPQDLVVSQQTYYIVRTTCYVYSNSLEKRLPDAMSVRECDTDMKL